MEQFADIISQVTGVSFDSAMSFLRSTEVYFSTIQEAFAWAGQAKEAMAEGLTLEEVPMF